MRSSSGWMVVALGTFALVVAGCGAAPGHEETTPARSEALRALEVRTPEITLLGANATHARFNMRMSVVNPNGSTVTMRRIDGYLFLDGQQVAHAEVNGGEPIEGNGEHIFVLDVEIPLQILMSASGSYIARGTLFADAGSGDGSLQTPFELSGTVPR